MQRDNPIREIRERYDLSVYRLAQILILSEDDIHLLEDHPDEIPPHLPSQVERHVKAYLAEPPDMELPPPSASQANLPLLMGEDEPHE